MNKKPNKFKNNKKFWKWVASSLFLIVFGISAVINIAYLPKYFALKNDQETTNSQVLNIKISASNQKNGDNKLFTYIYQTTQKTLGNLMTLQPKIYYLTLNGTWLEGIFYNDELIKSSNPYYWMIYQNGKSASVGISDLRLHQNDTIELFYKSY